MNSSSLMRALREVLLQDRDLLAALNDEAYVERHPCCFNSTIGGHIRHNLDHLVCFLDGLESGSVDYESRGRDPAVERDRASALALIDACLARLAEMPDFDRARALRVREESEQSRIVPDWLPSSVGRELQFLLGHTVHHNALIATLVSGSGAVLPDGFGVAPSTLRYRSKAAN